MTTVLILEDDLEFANLLKMGLESRGHEAEIVRSSHLAIERLEQGGIGMVLADIYIKEGGAPVPDGGLRLTGMITKARLSVRPPDWAKVPVVVITGALPRPGQSEILSVASSLGADGVLAKPFTPDDLHMEMLRLLPEID
ncbi:response regulator [Vannielia litorea]|uniref:response regulator n=1 Tax=Vannielia litorea TaxID=1217970 RepID=UPI001C944000|nr:response regulator [Vannielia litorea]MBY6151944.1 response regulator [Vannielia litorea]